MIFTCAPENEKRDGVDYRDVKAWFQQCRDYKIDVDRQLERIHRIYGSATKITQNLSGMPTASGNGDKSVMLLWISLRSRRGIGRW